MADSYEKRKKEHIALALEDKHQAGSSGLSKIRLQHSALPELNWKDIDISASIMGKKRRTPFFVCAMTGGHSQAEAINFTIAKICQKRGWMMGVGSQRKQLENASAKKEWVKLRSQFPDLALLGNLGLSQLIETPVEKVEELAEALRAEAMVIHTNPLQECLQPEGTPRFKGGKKALFNLAKKLSVPVCLKETGCGFSSSTLKSLCGAGLKAVDISGFGGTHWGRIEGERSQALNLQKQSAKTFSDWGNSTLSTLLNARECKDRDFEVWASGGIKNGLDAAKCLALGAEAVGWAYLILKKALEGAEALNEQMHLLENELKIALFCTGSRTIGDLRDPLKWGWSKSL